MRHLATILLSAASIALTTATAIHGQPPPDDRRIPLIPPPSQLPTPAPPPNVPERSTLSRIPSDDLAEQVARAVIELDHPDWRTREEATERLRTLDYDTDAIARLLDLYRLSPEQTNRLLTVLRFRLLNRASGAVGIRMAPNIDFGVEVIGVQPGMPAEGVLLPGDRIIAVEATNVRNSTHFGDLIKQKQPGDVVPLTLFRPQRDEHGAVMVDRDGRVIFDPEPLTLNVTLGDLNDLGREYVDEHRVNQERRGIQAVIRHAPQFPELLMRADGSPRRLGGSVDDYPALRELARQRALIERGELTITADMQSEWNRMVMALSERITDRTLTPDERLFMIQVMQRYIELIPRAPTPLPNPGR